MSSYRPRTPSLYEARTALGSFGERLAESHLVSQGMEILARNWRCRDGELDRVALTTRGHRRILVVVEVKTRYTQSFCSPVAAVIAAKYRRLRQLTALWLRAHPLRVDEIRIDVISITVPSRGRPRVEHLEGVYL